MRRIIATALALLLACSASATGLFDIVTKGSVDRSVTVDIIDSTDGTPETGVVFNTAGIDLWYRREGGALVSITEVTLASLTTAHTDGGFLHIANGTYRLDLPDAAFATGANYVDFGGTVTGMIVIGGRVRLIDANLEVANLAANVTQFGGSAGTFAGGRPEVNVTHYGGTAGTFTTGQPTVRLSAGTGTGQISLSSGAVTAGTVTDKTGYSLSGTQTFNVTGNITGNVTGSVGSVASGGISEASFATTTGSFAPLGVTRQGTAQGATSTTVTLDASAPFGDNTNVGSTIWIKGSSAGNYWQPCSVSGYVASTKVATVSCPSGFVTPTGTISYQLYGLAPASGSGSGLDAAGVRSAIGLASANLDTQLSGIQGRLPASLVSGRMDVSVGAYQTGLTPLQPTTAGRTLDVSATGEAGIDWANVGSPTTAVNLSGTTISTSQAVASVSGAVGSVTGNVGGNVTGSVGSVTGAVGSVTGNVGGTVNGLTATAQGNVRTAVGLASANLDTQLTAIDDFVDTEMAAVKATTDKLDTALELDGAVYRFTTNALENAPTGSGGASDWSVGEKEQIRYRLGIDGTATAPSATPTLATASALSTLTGYVDTEIATLLTQTSAASIRSALGMSSANLDAQLGAIVSALTTIDDFVDTEIAAIKAKTDQLTFGVANELNVNVESMNANPVCGTGDAGTPWTGCP